jgi:hypothetical protein
MANLKLLGASSGYTIVSASNVATPTTFYLPATDGVSGQVLSTNGSGQLAFVSQSGGSYTLPTATTTVLGGVKVDGSSITISGSGVISSNYTLPTASSSVLGGIKVGTGLAITNGVLSTTGGGGTASQADELLVGANYRSASIDVASEGTPFTIPCRDLDGNINAVLFQGTATSAQFADLAEKYIADSNYEPGTVVEFGGEFEVTIASDETTRVAGVISTNPGFIMNNGLECAVTLGERTATVALQGRVPCKVRGKISKGDMLVSGGDGYARPTTNPKMGTIIGKALEDYEGTDGIIEVVVGRL